MLVYYVLLKMDQLRVQSLELASFEFDGPRLVTSHPYIRFCASQIYMHAAPHNALWY